VTASRPILVACLGIFVLTAMDAVIKAWSADFPTMQIVTMRFVSGAVVMLGIALVMRPPFPTAEQWRANGRRAVLVAISASTFFYALARLPLAETLALSYTAPLLVAVFGAWMLGERPNRAVWLALWLGVAGTVVIVAGKFGRGTVALDGLIAVLVSTVSYALSLVTLRKRTATDPLVTIVLLQHLLTGMIVAPFGLWVWVPAAAPDFTAFILIGFMGTAGHLLLAYAFKHAEAARVGATEYTGFIWATLLGIVFFAEVPGIATFIGTALIIAGAIMAARAGRIG
jgi:S-adenosylmethionine uptake transporter